MTIIPFSIDDERGSISVRLSRNAGARHSGFDVNGPTSPMARWDLKGFPIIKATVAFSGTGYRALFGWIQIVHLDFPYDGRKKTVVDVMPSHIGLGVPFAYFGHLPSLFDAPARHPRSAGSFTAESFLCKPPLLARTGSIEFIAGFRWGYSIDGNSGKLTHFPVKQIGASVWVKNRTLIKKTYPKWKLSRSSGASKAS